MRAFTRQLLVAVAGFFCMVSAVTVFAAAKDSIYVSVKNQCENGSARWVVWNSDQKAIVVTIREIVSISGSQHETTREIPLKPGDEKILGCELHQKAHPGLTTIQFQWQVQDARYQ